NVVEVVRNASSQSADRFQFLGLPQLLLQFGMGGLGLLAPGDVLDNAFVITDRTRVVADRTRVFRNPNDRAIYATNLVFQTTNLAVGFNFASKPFTNLSIDIDLAFDIANVRHQFLR